MSYLTVFGAVVLCTRVLAAQQTPTDSASRGAVFDSAFVILVPRGYYSASNPTDTTIRDYGVLNGPISEAMVIARHHGLRVVIRTVPAAELATHSREIYAPPGARIGYSRIPPWPQGQITRGYRTPEQLELWFAVAEVGKKGLILSPRDSGRHR